eukprot:jgi/Botrbrau1/9514/Bobra.0211s0005.1
MFFGSLTIIRVRSAFRYIYLTFCYDYTLHCNPWRAFGALIRVVIIMLLEAGYVILL